MKKILLIFPILLAALMTSCLGDDYNDLLQEYADWKKQNEDYIVKMENLVENSEKVYTKVVPSWATSDYVLIRLHNDPKLTEKNLVAMSNSTVDIKYELQDIEGNVLDNSYSLTTWGDSIYRSQPNQNIMGMWTALTTLHVGDSATLVVPAQSGYGYTSSGSVKPFSTLIFHIKIKDVYKYDIKDE